MVTTGSWREEGVNSPQPLHAGWQAGEMAATECLSAVLWSLFHVALIVFSTVFMVLYRNPIKMHSALPSIHVTLW